MLELVRHHEPVGDAPVGGAEFPGQPVALCGAGGSPPVPGRSGGKGHVLDEAVVQDLVPPRTVRVLVDEAQRPERPGQRRVPLMLVLDAGEETELARGQGFPCGAQDRHQRQTLVVGLGLWLVAIPSAAATDVVQIGYLGLDVYEEEADLFFENLSDVVLQDDVFARLLTFPNVVITGHQGFFTAEALTAIAETTIANITTFEQTGRAVHEVSTEKLAP